MSNITLNITEIGMHTINYTCEKCFNISECPLPITIYHSNYQANWIWLTIVLAIGIFLMYRFHDNLWKALGFSMGAVLLLSLIGAYFRMISGLLMLIIMIVMILVTLWKYKEEIGL